MFLIGGINISKEIPKRENQGLNGVGVSVFALAFLLIGIPVASTYLIDLALFFGGEEVEYNSSDYNQEAPIWTNTGDSNASMCSSNDITTLDICHANTQTPQQPFYFKGDKYHLLPGCNNFTQYPAPLPNSGEFCGSDGYDLYLNFTNMIIQNRTFPEIRINIVGATDYICSSNNFGDSLIDYKLNLIRYSPIPNTNFFNKDESIEMKGTSSFDSGGAWDYSSTDLCNPTIQVQHILSLDELNQLEDFRFELFKDSANIVYLTIELDNLRTEDGTPYDYTNYYSPFQGPTLEFSYFNVVIPTYEVNAINFILKLGVLILGIGFWGIAIASTPFWNPTKTRLFG